MCKTRISIGVPVYNGSRYLAAALDSLLSQTFSDFELIICDNASTDDTEQIARRYAARDSRIRYHRNQTNIGAPRNYMRAFELSSGEYFRWANHDDLSGTESLERCIDILDRDPTVVLAYPKTRLIDAEGAVLSSYEDNMHIMDDDPGKRFAHVLERLGLNNALYGLMRPEVIKRARPMGVFLGSDVAYLAELSLYGKFWEVPEYLFYRRVHAQAFSSSNSAAQQAFYNPLRRTRTSFRLWRHTFDNVRAVLHAPLSVPEKARAIGVVGRHLRWNRQKLFLEFLTAVRPSRDQGR